MPLISAAIPIQQPRMRFFDAEGKPLVGGKVYSYKVGADLFRPTFRDANKTALNQNPIVLDEAGSALIYLSGSHLLKVFDKFDNFIEMRYLPVTEMRTYFYDKLGKPLKYGKVETYDIYSTIKKASYGDSQKESLNTNPVILDKNGSAVICIVGSYRLRVYDERGVFLWDEDFLRNVAFALTSKLYPLFLQEDVVTAFIANDAIQKVVMNQGYLDEWSATTFNVESATFRDILNSITIPIEQMGTSFAVTSASYRDVLNTYTPEIEKLNTVLTVISAVRKDVLIQHTTAPENATTSFVLVGAQITN